MAREARGASTADRTPWMGDLRCGRRRVGWKGRTSFAFVELFQLNVLFFFPIIPNHSSLKTTNFVRFWLCYYGPLEICVEIKIIVLMMDGRHSAGMFVQ